MVHLFVESGAIEGLRPSQALADGFGQDLFDFNIHGDRFAIGVKNTGSVADDLIFFVIHYDVHGPACRNPRDRKMSELVSDLCIFIAGYDITCDHDLCPNIRAVYSSHKPFYSACRLLSLHGRTGG